MGENIRSPSTANGYMVFVDDIKMFLGYLLKFSKINANGKWIFIFKTMPFNKVENVLEQAWIRHKMLNILGVVIMSK